MEPSRPFNKHLVKFENTTGLAFQSGTISEEERRGLCHASGSLRFGRDALIRQKWSFSI